MRNEKDADVIILQRPTVKSAILEFLGFITEKDIKMVYKTILKRQRKRGRDFLHPLSTEN